MLNDAAIEIKRAPERRNCDVFFDKASYSAFPHVVQMEDDELLLAFRQAPIQNNDTVSHTHPASVITVMRSKDRGQTWLSDVATQMSAGGGQELALHYFGKGKVGGALARHNVVPCDEWKRAGIPARHDNHYPYRTAGCYWARSSDWGLTWPLEEMTVLSSTAQPCGPPAQMRNEDILVPAYGKADSRGTSGAMLFRSSDKGKSWSRAKVIAADERSGRRYCEPAVIEVEPGRLLALHRIVYPESTRKRFVTKFWGSMFWQNESTDGGRNWSRPVNTGIVSGACPRMLKLKDGRILLTFGRREGPFSIRAMLSEDGGRSWNNTAYILLQTNPNMGYSRSLEFEDGQILTVSYAEKKPSAASGRKRGVTGIVGIFWRVP